MPSAWVTSILEASWEFDPLLKVKDILCGWDILPCCWCCNPAASAAWAVILGTFVWDTFANQKLPCLCICLIKVFNSSGAAPSSTASKSIWAAGEFATKFVNALACVVSATPPRVSPLSALP